MSLKYLFKRFLFGRGGNFCIKRYYNNRNIMKLHEKGMFQDIFPNTAAQDITELCNGGPQCVYAGFDPTGRSLHVGNLLVLVGLMHWQRGGHRVIPLVGGATGMVGDPSGRTKEREEQSPSVIADNTAAIIKSIKKLFDNHQNYFADISLPPVRVVDNSEWWAGRSAVGFVVETGRHLRTGALLSRASVAARPALSLMELCYQAMQAHDWLHLLRNHNCRFQIGGNDQMGNIVSGHDLISRCENKAVYGLTMPLITSESGDKYGKSGGNAVWLEEELTSAFELYQFLVRTPDSRVASLLHLFTFLTVPQVQDIVRKHMTKPETRLAQTTLAENVVLLVHGEEGLTKAKKATKAVYGSDVESLGKLTHEEATSVFRGATVVELLLQPGITVRDMAMSAKCFLTLNDADRIMKAGGFYVNYARVTNPDEVLLQGLHILPNLLSIIRVGKKNYWIIKWIK